MISRFAQAVKLEAYCFGGRFDRGGNNTDKVLLVNAIR
jgi:hypothetical protein